MLHSILDNVAHNLFKPLLLFFYAGFMIPLLKVEFEFPKPLYQALTIVLLLGIGWHGGEELSHLKAGDELTFALGFMAVGFFTNLVIGVLAYQILRAITKLRKVDAATVAGFYGSDSAGTFVTCVGFLTAIQVSYAPYMPVMLAIMEIPGCLVALVLVARFREQGMDSEGNMPGELNYQQVDRLFNFEFQGMLCLFLLEMGITACRRLKDLKAAGIGFVIFGVVAPNLFAMFGLGVAYAYSSIVGYDMALGTYVLFMILCGAASYIAVPAVQRLAIPEASPTLPLAASLGLTFSYNVTIGIPVYLEIAKLVTGAH